MHPLADEDWQDRLAYWREEQFVAEKHLEVATREITRCAQNIGQLSLEFGEVEIRTVPDIAGRDL